MKSRCNIRQFSKDSQTNPGNSQNSIVDLSIAIPILSILGFLPGLILAITYSSILSFRKGLSNNLDDSPSLFGLSNDVNVKSSLPSGIYRFALAEVLALLPILGLIYISQMGIFQLSSVVMAYERYIFPFLAVWLVTLVIFYLSRFFPARGGYNRDYRRDQPNPYNDTNNSTSDLLDIISDIADDLPSFGGGESGGGGSSKKF